MRGDEVAEPQEPRSARGGAVGVSSVPGVGWLGSPFDQRIFETDVRGLGVLCISNCPSDVPTALSTNPSVGTQTEDRSWNQTQGLGLQWPWRPFEFSADNSLASGGGRGGGRDVSDWGGLSKYDKIVHQGAVERSRYSHKDPDIPGCDFIEESSWAGLSGSP